jgi:nucleotide-binding universal stress UspA family protein
MKDEPMFKNILCPLDGSEHSDKALDLAIELAKAGNSGLVLFHGLLSSANSTELRRFAQNEGLAKMVEPQVRRLSALEGRLEYGYEEAPTDTRYLVEIGQHILDDSKRIAEEEGVSNVSTILSDGEPASQILRCVAERGIDCVIMGARGLSDVKALFLGSVSHKVANRVPCTCITVK